MNQNEAVIQTLEKLGGIATLGQLNQEVFKIKDCVWNTKTPFASIRRIVQQNKNIYKIRPGLWALESYRRELESKEIVPETEKNKNSKIVQEFSHSYYQGLLVTIGNMKKMQTFVPQQDRNKLFLREKLGDIRTLNEIPQYSFEHFVKRSETIDVIWFNERKMPSSFFEIEHSTDIYNSLLKFTDLQDFYTKMFIVADEKRYEEYKSKMQYKAFDEIRTAKRVNFLSYKNLETLYNQEIERQSFSIVL